MNYANFYKGVVEQFKNGRNSVNNERSSQEAGKIMLTVFWDTKGSVFFWLSWRAVSNKQLILLEHAFEQSEASYERETSWIQWRGVIFQQDNARPHAT